MLRAQVNRPTKKLSGNWMNKQIVSFDSKEENLHYEGVADIDPKELLKKKDQVVLIDVRQPDEYIGELGHIPGTELIVLDTIPDRIKELPKDKTIVFICRSGGRSARAAAFALSSGFEHVYNLKGGMILWNELHLPTEM